MGAPAKLSSGAPQPERPESPFWKTALVLWVLGIIGLILLSPYLLTLERKPFGDAARHMHLKIWQLLALSDLQTAVLLAIAVIAGLWASRRLGLRTPLVSACITGSPVPEKTGATLLISVVAGLAAAIFLVVLDHFVFAPIPSVAKLIKVAGTGKGPPAWQGFLASFYGGLDEEILMRLGVMSLLALGFRTPAKILGASKDLVLPSGVFWAANIGSAVLFGLGHLPATVALVPLSRALVIRAIVLNGAVGLVFGELFRRYGLEWAMISHFSVDMVAHVFFA
jgi:hypothetical protein